MHPLPETHHVSQTKRETEINFQFKKQEEHVPRHIELTAVLTEMLKQKNKSNRIERFE